MESPREFDVVVVGELNVDLILSGDVTPEFGQVEKLLDDGTLALGSSSGIFACGAARLGLRTAFVGKVGDDAFGRFVIDSLAARGVDTRSIVADPQIKTGLTTILSRRTDRAMLTYLGSIAALRFDEIPLELLARARHVHLGSYFLLDSLRPDVPRLFAAAHECGITVSLDTNYDPSEQWDGGLRDALKHVDIFMPNETELLAIAGQPDVDLALRVIGAHVPLIALKRGAQGATAQLADGTRLNADAIPVNVVDTTGAGDSFDAGFVYGHLQGWEVARSLRLACVTGALSTQGIGGTAAQPTLSEALKWL